jgi:hypothetical protein
MVDYALDNGATSYNIGAKCCIIARLHGAFIKVYGRGVTNHGELFETACTMGDTDAAQYILASCSLIHVTLSAEHISNGFMAACGYFGRGGYAAACEINAHVDTARLALEAMLAMAQSSKNAFEQSSKMTPPPGRYIWVAIFAAVKTNKIRVVDFLYDYAREYKCLSAVVEDSVDYNNRAARYLRARYYADVSATDVSAPTDTSVVDTRIKK